MCLASTQCFVFIPSWPVCLLPCVFLQSCPVLTLVHLTFSPSFSCHQCFSPRLPPPPQARCLLCVGLAFALFMVQPFGLYSETAARAMWAVLPSLGSTGCFVSFWHFDSRRRNSEGCTRDLTESLEDSQKDSFPSASEYFAQWHGSLQTNLHSPQCIMNTSHSNVLFLLQNVHSFSRFAIYTPGESLHHSLLFNGFYWWKKKSIS